MTIPTPGPTHGAVAERAQMYRSAITIALAQVNALSGDVPTFEDLCILEVVFEDMLARTRALQLLLRSNAILDADPNIGPVPRV